MRDQIGLRAGPCRDKGIRWQCLYMEAIRWQGRREGLYCSILHYWSCMYHYPGLPDHEDEAKEEGQEGVPPARAPSCFSTDMT